VLYLVFETIDKLQDIITLVAVPIATFLLIKLNLKIKKLNQKI